MNPNCPIPLLETSTAGAHEMASSSPQGHRAAPRLRLPLCLLLCSTLGGCASLSRTPAWDRHFGETVRVAMAQQIIDPSAAANPAPVNGLDGRAAKNAMDQYQKSFSAPEPQRDVLTIGVGNVK
jgi:hypothetical protein